MKIAQMIRDAALLGAARVCWPAQIPRSRNPPTNRPARPTPPTRDPHTPGFVAATELPDGVVPSAEPDGNFIIGPTHDRAPEITTNAPQGAVYNFTMDSADSKFYSGIAREPGTSVASGPRRSRQASRHHQPSCSLHAARFGLCPKEYVPGTAAPLIVGTDGTDREMFTALDNLIASAGCR